MKPIDVLIQVESEDLIPLYATEGAAGADLRANIQSDVEIAPGESRLIPTGMRCSIPIGYEIQVRPRSGLALRDQITVLNTPGTIDSDYRGEIGVILINHGTKAFTVTPKMRIAQMVLAPVCIAHFIREDSLALTSRGEGGFGHSGRN